MSKENGPNYDLYRVVTYAFREQMMEELVANHEKGDRDLPNGWLSMNPKQFLGELWYHTGKLQEAVKNNDVDLIKEYSADIANAAMMIYDKYCPLIRTL